MKNKLMRAATILLVLTLMTSCFVGSTFAKYTGSMTTQDTARVAKFEVYAFGTLIDTQADTVTIDLFKESEVYDTKGDADYTVAANDADIVDGTDYIIAPGSWGKFTFNVKNKSEVNVTYAIDYTVNEAGVPLLWSIDDGNTWTDDLANVSDTGIDINDTGVDTTILWKWDYTVDAARDTADTTLGFAGTAAPSIQIKVTFTQVD